MAKITATAFAANTVKLWQLLNALDALKERLKERGLWRNLRAHDKRDQKLIREYVRVRNAASAIVDAVGIAIEH